MYTYSFKILVIVEEVMQSDDNVYSNHKKQVRKGG